MTLLKDPIPTVHTYAGEDACRNCGGSPAMHNIRPTTRTHLPESKYRCSNCPCREYAGKAIAPGPVE